MSNPGEEDATPITSVRQLGEYLAQGCRAPEAFRIGTEHEKFGFRLPGHGRDWAPIPYEPDGIRAVLEYLAARGGTEIRDGGALIGLKQDGASLSLEPGGQFELSGAPLATLHETRAELDRHLDEARAAGEAFGIGWAPLGFHPSARREEMPWMPKSRYAIMRRYMPKVGRLGLDMMLRTCTVQVNLDFASEADMVRKLRVGLLLQPVATALFANSPFTEGRPNGFLSARAQVWTDPDPDRTGMPPVMFAPGFGFERYAEWAIDVPMYFVARGGRLIDVAGESFRAWMAGAVPALHGITPTIGDFADHLTTIFTDVRLKRFLEMRGADAGRPDMMVAQSALWVGLLYDPAALEAASRMGSRWEWQELAGLRDRVPREGLEARFAGGLVRDLARDALAIARAGLAGRARTDAAGRDESTYLDPLDAIVDGAPTQAEHWLQRYAGPWGGDVSRIWIEARV
jgi:glutamate--cysteine ligase